MKLWLVACISLFGLIFYGCATSKISETKLAPDQLNTTFRLDLEVRPLPLGALELKLTLVNISTNLQTIFLLTNVFEGTIELRCGDDSAIEFRHRDFLIMQATGFYLYPMIRLRPGESIRFVAPAVKFVDTRRLESVFGGKRSSLPYELDTEFQKGCGIVASIPIGQRKKTGPNQYQGDLVGKVVSAELRCQ